MKTAAQAVMFSSGKDDWGTPPELFAELEAEFGFTLDVAANATNHLCAWWLGPGSSISEDSLSFPWAGICWCNPPYSRGLQGQFIAKAAAMRRAGVTTVMLLPARTDTRMFHHWIWDWEKHQPRPGVEVRFLRGRVRFVGASAGAPFPSMVVVFRG